MSNEYPNFGWSSDDKGTSSSSFSRDENKFTRHVINLKESKTHVFYVIQPGNENSVNTPNLIKIKISKDRPMSRNLATKKMLLRDSNDEVDMSDKNQSIKKTPRPNLASIRKRTDHPSFYVLPEVFSEKRSIGSINKKIDRNQSTSDNSNETYTIRSKEENKLFESFVGKLQKSEDYCECNKDTVVKSKDPSNRDSSLPKLQHSKLQQIVSANNTSPIYPKNRNSGELFKIKYVEPTQVDSTQRLRAGQDCETRYKSCYVCPNMTRIFPQTSSRRRSAPKSNYPDNDSNLSQKNCNGYVNINYKSVRHCLIYGSTNEKCEVLDAIRLRMKSSDLNVATNTIEDIVRFDLFGVQCECRSKPLLEELFWPINVTTPYPLQTSIARFLNALVSFKIGRSYFNNRSIIQLLTWGDIGRDNIDETMGDNLIGIMMKLSCNRSQWSDMIKNGLLSWLLTHMEDVEYSASKYHITMMTGLLRNLLRGENINNLAPIEIQKLIVLLGRYLDAENSSAKSNICDSLLTLFQNREVAARAKELNFPKIIEEHLMKAGNSKQKEHLRAVNQLLNGSGTSFNHRKFNSRSEEPFLDIDLEPNAAGEVDYYPGECLLKDKFSGNEEVQCDKNKPNKFKKTNSDGTRKDGKLVSRVFVEHLNCFLPKIDKNRIFPLCNSRCADKITTCSHIGDVQPKKRQPYIPPNSRTSGLSRQLLKQDLKWMIPVDTPWSQQSVDEETITTVSDKDNKSVILQSKTDNQLENSDQSNFITRIYTISHDKSAAKWNNFENRVDTAETSVKSLCMNTNKTKRSFLKRSKTTGDVDDGKDIFSTTSIADKELVSSEFPIDAKSEKIIRCMSYHNEPFKSTEALNENRSEDPPVTLEGLVATQRIYSKNGRQSPVEQNITAESETRSHHQISSDGKTSQIDVTGAAKHDRSVTKSEEGSRRMNKQHDFRNSKSLDQDSVIQIKKIAGSEGDTQSSISRINREHVSPDIESAKALEISQQLLQNNESESDRRSSGSRMNRKDDLLNIKAVDAPQKGQESLLNKTITGSQSDRQSSGARLNTEHDSLNTKSVDQLKRGEKSFVNKEIAGSKSDCRSYGGRMNTKNDSINVEAVDAPDKGQESSRNKGITGSKSDRQSSGSHLNREHDSLNIKSVDALEKGQESLLNKKIIGSKSDRQLSAKAAKDKEGALDNLISRSKYVADNIKSDGFSDNSLDSLKDKTAVEIESHKEEKIKHDLPSATESGQQSSSRPTTQSIQNVSEHGIGIEPVDRFEEISIKKTMSGEKSNRQLNARSEEVVSSKRNIKLLPDTMGHQLHARSLEVLGRSKKIQKLPAGSLSKSVCSINELSKTVSETESKHELINAKSEQALSSNSEVTKANYLHARSLDILRSPKPVEIRSDNQPCSKKQTSSKDEVVGIDGDSRLSGSNDKAGGMMIYSSENSIRSKQTNIGEQDVGHPHARSEEVLVDPKTSHKSSPKKSKETFSVVKSNNQLNARSEEVLKSNRNLKLSRGPKAKDSPNNKVTMPQQLHARSAETFRPTNEVRGSSSAGLTKSMMKNTSKSSNDVVGGNKRDRQLSGNTIERDGARTSNLETTIGRTKNVADQKNEKNVNQILDISKGETVAVRGVQELLDIERQTFTDKVISERNHDNNQQRETEIHNVTDKVVSNEKSALEMCEKSPNPTHQQLARQTGAEVKDEVENFTAENNALRNEMLSKSKDKTNRSNTSAKLIGEDKIDQGVSRKKSLEEIYVAKSNDQSRHTKSLEEIYAAKSNDQSRQEANESYAKSEDILANPEKAQELSTKNSLGEVKSDNKLLKARSEEIPKCAAVPTMKDNSISAHQLFQLFPRSVEVIVRQEEYGEVSRHQTESKRDADNGVPNDYQTFQNSTSMKNEISGAVEHLPQDKNQNAGLTSGYSSDSSINKSRDCIDCEGKGTVLRARASQPCENCKASLTKYRKFVEVLNNEVSPSEDDQQRVVTRTIGEAIKVTWTNKSKETPTMNNNQDQTKDEQDKDGNLNLKKSSENLKRDTDPGDATQSKESTSNEEIKKSSSQNQTGDTNTEKSGGNQDQQLSKSKEQAVDHKQGKSTKEVETNDQPSSISSMQNQAGIYIESGSSDIKENISMSKDDHEIEVNSVSAVEIKNTSAKLSESVLSGDNKVSTLSEIPATLTKSATRSEKSRNNLVTTKNADSGEHDDEGALRNTLKEETIVGAKDHNKNNSNLPPKLVTKEIPKDKSVASSENQLSNVSKKLSLSFTSVSKNINKSLIEPLRGLSLNLTLNASGINKHLSFGTVRQTSDNVSPKFVENIVGETITTSEGNECLQTTTVRKSKTVSVEESIKSDLKINQASSVKNYPVEKSEEQVVEIEILSNCQGLKTTISEKSTEQGLLSSRSDILSPRSIEIVTDKASPGSFLQSIRKEEGIQSNELSSPEMADELVERKSEQLASLQKSTEQIAVNRMEHLDVTNKLSRDVSASSVEKLKSEEMKAVKSDLLDNVKETLEKQVLQASSGIKADSEAVLNSSEILTDTRISRKESNEQLSVSLLKQPEDAYMVVETLQNESTPFRPTTASSSRTSKEQVGDRGVVSKTNVSFENRSNEVSSTIVHSLSVPLVLNSKETVSCIRGYQNLSEEKFTTETNASEGTANCLFVASELIEHSAESSTILSPSLKENVKDEAPEVDQLLPQHRLVSSQNISPQSRVNFEDKKLEDKQYLSQNQLVEDVKRKENTPQKSIGVMTSRPITNQHLTEFPAKPSNTQIVAMMSPRSVEVVTDKIFNRHMTKREWESGGKQSVQVNEKVEDSSKQKEKQIAVISTSNSIDKTGGNSDPNDILNISEGKAEEEYSSLLLEKSRVERSANTKSENIIPEQKKSLMEEAIVGLNQSKDSTVQQSQTNDQPSNYLTRNSTDRTSGGVNCGPTDAMQPVSSERKTTELDIHQTLSPTFNTFSKNDPKSSKILNPKSIVPKLEGIQPSFVQKDQKAIPTLMDEPTVNQLCISQSSIAQQLSPKLPDVKEGAYRGVGGITDQVPAARSMVDIEDKTTAEQKRVQHLAYLKNQQPTGEAAHVSKDPNTKSQAVECEEISNKKIIPQGLFDTVSREHAVDDAVERDDVSVSLVKTIVKKLEDQGACSVTCANLLFARSVEIIPASSPLREHKQDEDNCFKAKEVLSHQTNVGQENGKYLPGEPLRKVTKSIGSQKESSKISVVSTTVDEVVLEERILSSERQTEQGTSRNHQQNDDHTRLSNVQRGTKEKNKLRVINSSCWRKLLDNDELINKLSEKVLQKLLTEIHMCGPNCKHPCGGLNPYYNANEDNNQNSE